MKYRLIGLVITIVLMSIYAFFIMPKLDLQNNRINLISIVVVFTILAAIGTISRNIDKR
ncbi:hypothetical protein GCM10010896_14090 [Mammaliicoccus stepanovicii]|uniref:Uncharacterized protein n=1 Tax=Mammaliicoccus stepanovicii TaxID=643214 RepID=A0A239ZLJ7_9STAP|nr:hypothetical protein GCM10010896_14090 [Mammaliicoccus stepanovicii]SNV71857.1 Uncharacterised protein [Mammaliicoccus stepanovicii]